MKKVAIVGVEGSGKTVMLAGLGDLYSHPDENGCFLSPKNFTTASYVATKIERMRGGVWPSATAEDAMQGLNWTLKRKSSEGRRPTSICELSCLDFAGETYRAAFGIKSEAGAVQAQEVDALKSYVRSADEIIVLINLRDVIEKGMAEPRVQESMWITNSILSFALDASGRRRAPRAAIVLSQADMYADTIRACGGARKVLEKYLPHVANDYDWLDVFEVYAVDKTDVDNDGNVVPAPDFSPVGLSSIVKWIMMDVGSDESKEDADERKNVEPKAQDDQAPLSVGEQDGADTGDRMNRSGFWGSLVVGVLMFAGGAAILANSSGTIGQIFGGILALAGFLMNISSVVQRFHDIGLSGWFALTVLVPYLNFITFIVLGFVPGQKKNNRYGPPPK